MPKNITVSSYSPRFILKAAFHSSPCLIWILLYPLRTSIFEKYLAPFNLSMSSVIKGRGYAFLTVYQLSCLFTRWNIFSKWWYVQIQSLCIHLSWLSYILTADDEKVRIWDVEWKRPYQVICDELKRWGQITSILWLYGFSENSLTVCFRTGRGLFLIYQQAKEAVSLCNKLCLYSLFISGYLQTIIQYSHPPI